jgi:DNA mismatch repair protein MutH
MAVSPPQTRAELLARAQALAGLDLARVAEQLALTSAINLRREKGWMGQLIEQALGAQSGSLAQPDFPQFGIELKTIPVDANGDPLESTWVCVAPLLPQNIKPWPHSLVCAKLSQVLWLPILAERGITLPQRVIGQAFLWQPNATQQAQLQQDYNELTERIAQGEIASITAHHGAVLQLRPKAANNRVTTNGIGPDGQGIQTAPRGFYLRRQFTRAILRAHFL